MFLLFLILQLTSVKFYARVIFFHLNFFYVSVIVFIASPSIKAIKRWNKECCDEKFGLVGEKMKNVPTKVLMRSRALLQASEKLELAITHALSLSYTHTHTHTHSNTHSHTHLHLLPSHKLSANVHQTVTEKRFLWIKIKKWNLLRRSFLYFLVEQTKIRFTIHKNA